MTQPTGDLHLLCQVDGSRCALPLEHVVETMRPLPIQPLLGAPSHVLGAALIRGNPVPVIDLPHMLNGKASEPERFVTIRVGTRLVALAVSGVVGIRPVPPEMRRELPPLFRSTGFEGMRAIGVMDAELLVVLEAARMVPEATWDSLGTGAAE
jgi:purine-binding chemotaxis protein CheW